MAANYISELTKLQGELRTFIDSENCAPICVRLAWHDSGTFDASTGQGEPSRGFTLGLGTRSYNFNFNI